MQNDDVAIIQRVLAGDETAFAELVNKYQKPVHALAWRKIGDFHIAEDITQDTFLKAYQRLHTLKDPNQFTGWLYVIAANLCATWLRKKRIQTQPLEDTETTMTEEDAYSRHVTEERRKTAVAAQREVVKKLLAQLKESERTVMTLYYLGEMKVEEISRFLGVSASTIKSRLRRARHRLKEEEPMIREALDHFQITPNLTENIMQEISRLKPVAPSGSKPLVPWAIGVSTIAVIFFMLGVGNQYLSRFQKPYSFEAASEMTVELIEAPVVRNLASEPDVRTQVGSTDTPGKGSASNRQPDAVSALVADAQSDETDKDWTQWQLPKEAKARFGKGGINAIEFSPDGMQLAVGTNIGVWLYDVETGAEKSLFKGAGRVLAFSPDGRFLANGGKRSDVGNVQLWEIATGREVLFPDVYDTALALQFSSDGKTLVSVGSGGQFIIRLNTETKEMTSKFFKRGESSDMSDETGGVYAITHDKVAIGRADGKIQLWDIATYKVLSTLKGHTDLSVQQPHQPAFVPKKHDILAVVFSRDGSRLASGGRDKRVRLWDLANPDKWITLEEQTGWTNVLAFSPDGKMLASGGTDKTVQLWDTATGKPLATFTGHIDAITALAFSPDSTTLASGSADGTLRFWHAGTGTPLPDRITGHAQSLTAATFFEDSSTLASVAFNGVITFWDMKTLQKSAIQDAGHRDMFPSLAFSPDGTKLVSVGAEGYSVRWGNGGFSLSTPDRLVRLTDVKTGRELTTLPYSMGVKELTFSPDGETVAFAGLGEIRLWNTRTGDEQEITLAELKPGMPLNHIPKVVELAFSPHGTWLVSATQYGKIQMWDVATGGALAVFAEPTEGENLGRISALRFSPDGTLLAIGTDGYIHLWEVDTANKLFSVSTEHQRGRMFSDNSASRSLVFSPDGKVLVNGLDIGTIQLWDVTTGDQIAALDGHRQDVNTLVFSPDGKVLVSTAADGTIFVWDWDKTLSGSPKSE